MCKVDGLVRGGDEALFHRLEALGERAVQVHDQPDAGLWELRGSARVHTFSSVMCWAACDRLAKIAERLGLAQRRDYWHCLLYTSPSPRERTRSRIPSSS